MGQTMLSTIFPHTKCPEAAQKLNFNACKQFIYVNYNYWMYCRLCTFMFLLLRKKQKWALFNQDENKNSLDFLLLSKWRWYYETKHGAIILSYEDKGTFYDHKVECSHHQLQSFQQRCTQLSYHNRYLNTTVVINVLISNYEMRERFRA